MLSTDYDKKNLRIQTEPAEYSQIMIFKFFIIISRKHISTDYDKKQFSD